MSAASAKVYAGDDALYTPRRGMPVLVRVWGHTPKRVGIVVRQKVDGDGLCFKVKYVKPERLERRGGGC